MGKKKITFSPVTRLSGLLSIDMMVDYNKIIDAKARSTMFRGFEWIMQDRHIKDAVYMTQRVCGICSLAHGAVGSYLLDEIYNNQISRNAQLLRNIMFAADFLQNHIRHFYVFSLPDFVKMPVSPPWLGQNLKDARLNRRDNQVMIEHYFSAVKAAQESHQLLTIFGGKAPHQHSFVDGGVSIAPTVDKISSALALISNIYSFVADCMIPDTELISRVYSDYYMIGINPVRLLSFGLFRTGKKNDKYLWRPGVIFNNIIEKPSIDLISEGIAHSYFKKKNNIDEIRCQGEEFKAENKSVSWGELEPAPDKEQAYSWTKTVHYGDLPFETGPLARAIIRGDYQGVPSTMARIVCRSMETLKLTKLVKEWLYQLQPGPVPLKQGEEPIKNKATATTDAMRGALLHSAEITDEKVMGYNIITPTAWNFSPTDQYGIPGPVENALIGTEIRNLDDLYTITGRIIRSFDPCISCATHVLNIDGKLKDEYIL